MSFTVVIPLYNKRAFVVRALQSAMAQTHAPLEILVVDDGSTDGSAQEVQRIGNASVRLIEQANGGAGAARNTGLHHARGQWVAFLDADDWWWPEHLAALHQIVVAQPQARLIATACLEVSEGQTPRRRQAVPHATHTVDYFAVAARQPGRVNSSCAAVRRHEALQMGGFSQTMRLGEDLDFWCRMACHWPVALSENVTAVYCRGTGGAMESPVSRPQDRQPLTLPEISAPIGSLLAHLRVCDDGALRQSITDYINSRVHGSVKAALWSGQVAFARHLAALMIEPVAKEFQFWRAAPALPQWAWALAARLRSALRKIKSILARRVGRGQAQEGRPS